MQVLWHPSLASDQLQWVAPTTPPGRASRRPARPANSSPPGRVSSAATGAASTGSTGAPAPTAPPAPTASATGGLSFPASRHAASACGGASAASAAAAGHRRRFSSSPASASVSASPTTTVNSTFSSSPLSSSYSPPLSSFSTVASSSSSPSFSPSSAAAAHHHHQHRRRSSRLSGIMPEYRHVRGSSLTIPNNGNAGAANRNSPSAAAMARSPPNTAHVPCKFFRQGACQAGNACPFSHDLGAASETICKYFAKGNCKFGPKCANIHVLPDGRRVNYGKNGFTIITTPGGVQVEGPASPTSAGFNTSAPSALTSSLFQNDSYINADGQPIHPAHHRHQLSVDNGHPSDSPYSLPSSTYGSPREGLGLSPLNGKGLSILDAPLPASFDSNGISNAARFPAAPWPSSVPSKFGFESPSSSFINASKDARTSDTLKLLHSSAFGSEHLTPTASSPPNSQNVSSEEYFGKRAMHSSRYAKPKMLSSSMPKTNVDRDWGSEFAFDDDNGDNVPENYLPENLQDLLTPAEKARRSSMRGENDVDFSSLSKYGSPMGSSPSSRWGPLFQRQKEEEEMARSARNAGSAFGHVGSPLRNSTLAQEMGERLNSASASGRPSSQRISSDSMSVLSQQLQRSRIDEPSSTSSPHLHPATARVQGGASAIGKERAMERHVSTGSISSSVTGRFTTPIDEEDPAFVFSMEEEEDASIAARRKRVSAGLGLGGITSYAGAVASKAAAAKSSKTSAPSEQS